MNKVVSSRAMACTAPAAGAWRRPGPALLALAVSVLLTLLLYGSSLRSWWCCDDINILLHASSYSPWEVFFDPLAYRALIPYSLQSLLTVSFGLDRALFGLRPAGFYAHQLLSIALSGWLVQRILVLWTPAPLAYGAMALVLAGTPVAFASQALMARHYIDGLALFLLALWLVLLQLRGGAGWLRWPAVLAFALALSAKEIFVPLGLLPFLLPLGTVRQRWRALWPWLLVLVLYVGWRRYMLGEFIGGYLPSAYLPAPTWGLLGTALSNAAALLWPTPWPWLAAALLGLAGLGVALARLRRAQQLQTFAWLGALAGMLMGPLVPLAGWPGFGPGAERYLLMVWVSVAGLLALALAQLARVQNLGIGQILLSTLPISFF